MKFRFKVILGVTKPKWADYVRDADKFSNQALCSKLVILNDDTEKFEQIEKKGFFSLVKLEKERLMPAHIEGLILSIGVSKFKMDGITFDLTGFISYDADEENSLPTVEHRDYRSAATKVDRENDFGGVVVDLEYAKTKQEEVKKATDILKERGWTVTTEHHEEL